LRGGGEGEGKGYFKPDILYGSVIATNAIERGGCEARPHRCLCRGEKKGRKERWLLLLGGSQKRGSAANFPGSLFRVERGTARLNLKKEGLQERGGASLLTCFLEVSTERGKKVGGTSWGSDDTSARKEAFPEREASLTGGEEGDIPEETAGLQSSPSSLQEKKVIECWNLFFLKKGKQVNLLAVGGRGASGWGKGRERALLKRPRLRVQDYTECPHYGAWKKGRGEFGAKGKNIRRGKRGEVIAPQRGGPRWHHRESFWCNGGRGSTYHAGEEQSRGPEIILASMILRSRRAHTKTY